MKTAIITGITGQDGSYLAENLLDKDYKVIGLYRRSSTNTFNRIKHINNPNFILQEYDITDPNSCVSLISYIEPDELLDVSLDLVIAKKEMEKAQKEIREVMIYQSPPELGALYTDVIEMFGIPSGKAVEDIL